MYLLDQHIDVDTICIVEDGIGGKWWGTAAYDARLNAQGLFAVTIGGTGDAYYFEINTGNEADHGKFRVRNPTEQERNAVISYFNTIRALVYNVNPVAVNTQALIDVYTRVQWLNATKY